MFSVTRPGNRTGALLILTGRAWLLGEWDNPYSGSAATLTLGLLLFAAAPPLVGWVILAYPTGRLSSVVERIVIGAGFIACVVVLGLLPTLFFDPGQSSARSASTTSPSSGPTRRDRTT